MSQIKSALNQATESNAVTIFKEYTGLSDAEWDALISGKIVALRCQCLAHPEGNRMAYYTIPLASYAYDPTYQDAETGDTGVQVVVTFTLGEDSNFVITYTYSPADNPNITVFEFSFHSDYYDYTPDPLTQ